MNPELYAAVDGTDEDERIKMTCNKDTCGKKHCRSKVGDTFLLYEVVASLTLGSHCMSKLYISGF